ncbi:MAG TPA: alpha/beta fold hydrolase [Geminicoccaceae bacterium]|nr:alpha/beta fold hydrolase [Geminicoccaceae bacterium]
MRCPRCEAENRPGRRFCNQCGASLAGVCPACGFANEPDDRFCGGCGAGLAPAGLPATASGTPEPPAAAARPTGGPRPVRSAVEGERKWVTVLFADVRGSLALIESRDPEEAQRLLDPVIEAMTGAIHRFEGTVAKVLGDGVMALFGAPRAYEDHAPRACYAALAVRGEVARAAADLGAEPQVRVGLHSGEVVLRTTGTDLSLDYDAIGPTVHLAARMEQLAAPGTIRLTADTARLAEGLVRVEALGAVEVKGLTAPVSTFELIGVGTGRPRTRPPSLHGSAALVGRDAELAALGRALDAAGRGRGQVVAAVGEPGLGKSRLFEQFLGSSSPELSGWRVLATSCPSYGGARPWLPVIALLKDYFGIEDRDDPRAIAAKVLGALAPWGEAMRPVRVACLALLDAPGDDREWRALDPPQRRRRTLDAVRGLLLREAGRQPLVLVVEDLHWIDGETQALLDTLVDGLPGSRLLLLVNYRPEYAHGWGNRTCYTQLRVDPLSAEGAERLLSALLGEDPGLAPVRRLLLARAEGNPLFLEESVRALAEAGALAGEPGAYRLNGSPGTIDLPATVQAIVAARIDRLPDEAKHVLQRAAVVGREVAFAILAAIVDLPEDGLWRQLEALRAAEFLYETRAFPEPGYAFTHALTHEVAYGGLLRDTRRRLHRRVGEALEALYPERRGELTEALADHFERGEVWPKAARYALDAAGKAKMRYAYAAGVAFAERALAAAERDAGPDAAAAATAHELLGDLASLLGDVGRANEGYERAAERTSDPAVRRRVANKRHRASVAVRDGARIVFHEHGSGDETLLFVTPLIYDTATFQPVLERLCQEFRIINVCPRGTGGSDPLVRPYTLLDHAADVRAVIEAAGAAPVTGIGISRGGNLLIHLAISDPGLLRRLVLVSSPTGAAPLPAEIGRALADGDPERAFRLFLPIIISEPGTEELIEQRRRLGAALPGETVLSFFDPDPALEIAPLLDRVRTPTLVMHGTADRRVPLDHARHLASHIAGARLYTFAGRCHLPSYTATQEFCDVLRAFVRTGRLPEVAATAGAA